MYSYKAFLSYSHSADSKLSPRLQSALQSFGKPWNHMRVFKIFRDKTSLSANPGLWPSIERALAESEFLLLMASPLAAKSPWVEREVAWWLENRSIAKLLILLTDGEMVWDAAGSDYDWSATTALSPNLRGRFTDEPLYVDLRWARSADNLTLRNAQYRNAILDIAAPLNGKPKDELDSEEIRQYRKTRQIRNAGMAALICLTAIASYAGYVATRQSRIAEERRREADRQRVIAEERLDQARRSLYVAQLSRIGNTDRKDSSAAIRMLEDVSRCPLDLREFTWGYYTRLFGSPDAPPQRVFENASSAIRTIAFSRDGRTIATPAPNGIQLLNLETGDARVIESPGGSVLSVAISPDGKLLAAVTDSILKREAWLWDLVSDHAQKVLESSLNAVRFSHDGKSLVLAGHGELLLWDLAASKSRMLLKGLRGPITVAAFSPDDRSVAAGGWDKTVRLVDVVTGAETFTLKGHTATVIGLAFSPDGNTLSSISEEDKILAGPNSYLGHQKPEVIAWDLRSGTHRLVIQAEDDVPIITALCISPDGNTLATGHQDGSVALWDPRTWERRGWLRAGQLPILALEFSPDGKRLAGGTGRIGSFLDAGTPGVVNIWEAEDWKERAVLRGHKGMVYSLAFSPDGAALVSSSGYDDGEVMAPGEAILWDVVTGRSRNLFNEHDNAAFAVAFSPDGKQFAVATRSGVHLLAADTGDDRLLQKSESTSSARVDFSPDGKTLAVADERGPVRLLDANTGRQIAALDARGPLAFSPDGQTLATTSPDLSAASLWALPARTEARTLRGHSGPIHCLAFSRDGATLATGGEDKSVKLWDRVSGKDQATMDGHLYPVHAVAFSLDGTLLAAGTGSRPNAPGEFRLWDLRGRTVVKTVPEPAGPVLALAFSPDGRLLATAGRGSGERLSPGEVRLWQVAALRRPDKSFKGSLR
jgi:WD40 repeat protein